MPYGIRALSGARAAEQQRTRERERGLATGRDVGEVEEHCDEPVLALEEHPLSVLASSVQSASSQRSLRFDAAQQRRAVWQGTSL